MGLGLSHGLGFGSYFWSVAHVRRWSGRQDLSFVSCNHCHLVRVEKMPGPRNGRAIGAPAGLAVSPDGKRLYIALDDLDEIAEADTASRGIIRKVKWRAGQPASRWMPRANAFTLPAE